MPPLKAPSTLWVCCLNTLADTLLNISNESKVLEFWRRSPPGCNFSNCVVESVLKKYNFQVPLRSLMKSLIFEGISRLDLSGFYRLGPVSSQVFMEFEKSLSGLLTRIPKIRELVLKAHNKFTYIPKVHDRHLYLIGSSCPDLEFLDVSYNRQVTGEGLRYLSSCTLLRKLYIFSTSASERDALKLIDSLPLLVHLGFKSMGNVIKSVYKRHTRSRSHPTLPLLELTHLDNTGENRRRYGISNLRCKSSIIDAIKELCPKVQNVKFRVKDDDVLKLKELENVRTVELIYNVRSPTSPSDGTLQFFSAYGVSLSSVAILCSSISTPLLTTIAQGCPGLESFWCRCNYFFGSSEPDELNHNYLKNLKTLYFRVGETEFSVVSVPQFIFPYLLCNAGNSLAELTIILRAPFLTDAYIYELFVEFNLKSLEKLMILMPGANNISGIIPLTIRTIHFALDFCPNMYKIGNISSWTMNREEVKTDPQTQYFLKGNYVINIVDKIISRRFTNNND